MEASQERDDPEEELEDDESRLLARVVGRQDALLGQIGSMAGSIRSLACERRAADQPHRRPLCALLRQDDDQGPLTDGDRQAACRTCLT